MGMWDSVRGNEYVHIMRHETRMNKTKRKIEYIQ